MIQAAAMEQRRWCKRCKAVFVGAVCPQRHANFMYTKRIPKAAEEVMVGGLQWFVYGRSCSDLCGMSCNTLYGRVQ